jgi:DNA-binding transcriptional LysR family regulator
MFGKHIRSLKTRLATRLLTRTTRRQSLTEIGRQYYERCRGAKNICREARQTARSIRDHAATPELTSCVDFVSERFDA